MVSRAAAAVVLALSGTAALAQDSQDYARGLGQLLGAAERCALAFDTDAVAVFVEKHADPSDMQFNGTVGLFERAEARQMAGYSETQALIMCVQHRRVAKTFGLLKAD
jgi:hypothetical protein